MGERQLSNKTEELGDLIYLISYINKFKLIRMFLVNCSRDSEIKKYDLDTEKLESVFNIHQNERKYAYLIGCKNGSSNDIVYCGDYVQCYSYLRGVCLLLDVINNNYK